MLSQKPLNNPDILSGIFLPDENIYGIRKKASFLATELIALQSRLGRPPRVMDFGCGNCENIGRTLVSTGCEYWGVDMHEASLDHARNFFSTSATTFCAEPPTDVLFDVIVYGDVIEHLDDPVSVLNGHRHLLDDNGMIIGAIPNGYGPFEIENWLNRKLGLRTGYDCLEKSYYAFRHKIARFVKTKILKKTLPAAEPLTEPLPFNFDSGHVQFFTQAKFSETLVRAGYRVPEMINTSFVGGQLTGQILRNCPGFNRFNTGIADFLPRRMVSGWAFKAVKGPLADGRKIKHD